MRPIRALLLFLAVLAATVGVLALGLYGIARLSWSERQVAAWLTDALGLPINVDALAVGYFPQPWLEVEGLSIADTNAEPVGLIVEVDRLGLVVPWRTVFGRGLRVERLDLASPRVHLARDAAGRANWDELGERITALMAGESLAWSLGEFDVDGGSVGYRDEQAGTIVEATGVALTGGDIEPGRFFPMQARAALQSAGYIFHAAFDGQAMVDPDRDAYAAQVLKFDGWIGGGELGLGGVKLAATIEGLTADLAAGTAAVHGLEFDGLGVHASLNADADGLGSAPAARFTLGTAPFAPRTIGYSLNKPLPATADAAALGRAAIDIRGEWSEAGLRLDDVRGELDDSRFNGSVWLPADGSPPKVRLNVDRLDLDRYLPPESPETRSQASPQVAVEALLHGLEEMTVDAEVAVGVAQAAGVTARDLKVTLVPDRSVPTGAAP
jgi:AsmA protein